MNETIPNEASPTQKGSIKKKQASPTHKQTNQQKKHQEKDLLQQQFQKSHLASITLDNHHILSVRIKLNDYEIVDVNMESHFLLVTSLQQSTKLITAAFGKPTYPINPYIAEAMLRYWNEVQKSEKAIDYGQPQGRFQYRDVVAEALSKEYKIVNKFKPEDVVFTVGGIGGIHAIFYAINNLYPDGKIVTPLPYYPYYTRYKNSKNTDQNSNSLHFIDLFKSGNLTLNAEAVKESMTTITANEIGAFLFCDPCNPSGTTPSQEEWKQIALILLQYPDVPIILDEAYREMVYDKENLSLITVAPELLHRIVLIRSATKGLSAAGERMAVVVTKHRKIIRKLTDYINIAHLNTPISAQYAYSQALLHTNSEYSEMANFYQNRVNFMKTKLKEIDVLPKNIIYNPGSSFYLIADLSKLEGRRLNNEAQDKLLDNRNGTINTDIEVVYHLLYKYNLAICPLSFFGADPRRLMVRITCSESFSDLEMIYTILKTELEQEINIFSDKILEVTSIQNRLELIQKSVNLEENK